MATNEVKKEELKKSTPIPLPEGNLLLVSEIKHDVSRVIEKKKGLSFFKFGRIKIGGNNKKSIIPTRVPSKFGQALLDTYPDKYSKYDETKLNVDDWEVVFKGLIQDQDEADRIEKEKEEKEAEKLRLEEQKRLEATGAVKKVVRE